MGVVKSVEKKKRIGDQFVSKYKRWTQKPKFPIFMGSVVINIFVCPKTKPRPVKNCVDLTNLERDNLLGRDTGPPMRSVISDISQPDKKCDLIRLKEVPTVLVYQ